MWFRIVKLQQRLLGVNVNEQTLDSSYKSSRVTLQKHRARQVNRIIFLACVNNSKDNTADGQIVITTGQICIEECVEVFN